MIDVDVWVRGRVDAKTETVKDIDDNAQAWTVADVKRLLEGMLLALQRTSDPNAEPTPISMRGFSWIVSPDDDGVLVYHPDPATRFKSLAPLSQKQLDEIKADQRFRRDKIDSVNMPELSKTLLAAKEPGNYSYVSTISNKEEITGYAPVKGHIWVVAVSETKEEFSAPLDRLFSNVLYSVFLVGMVFLLLAMLFARSIVSPIQELQTAALALKSGDYDKASVRVDRKSVV